MKEGPIGRGRGSMSAEQFEQAQQQIERNKAAPRKTPEQVRQSSRVVGAGEISPAQPTQKDEAYLRTKGHALRGAAAASGSGDIKPTSRFSKKQQTEAALRGKVFVPRSEMNEADMALMRQRQAMARQVLSRNAPPTEEGVVYVPDWGEYDAGKTMRTAPGTQPIGKAPEKEDMDGTSGMRTLKSPLEVIDMLRTMNFHLRDTFRARGEEVEAEAAAAEASRANSESQEEEEEVVVDVGEEEMQVMRVRLLRDHWLHYLEDTVGPMEGVVGDDGEPKYEMDPAKHDAGVREDFLAEIKEAISNGMPLHWPSDEECVEMAVRKRTSAAGSDRQRIMRQRQRTARDAAKIVSLANKLARDLQDVHGASESVAIKDRFDVLMTTFGFHPSAADIDASLRASIAAVAILEVYLGRAEEAEVHELEVAAKPLMSQDWPPRRGGAAGAGAVRGGDWRVTRHFSEYSDDGYDDDSYAQGSTRMRMQADWERGPARPPPAAAAARRADGDGRGANGDGDGMLRRAPGGGIEVGQASGADLSKGDKVAAKVLGPTPLGYNVMVNGEREGLVYHSEVFDDEPLTPGALLEAWVLKVRADGKLDVSLRQPAVQQRIQEGARNILRRLLEQGGSLAVGDKSRPDAVAAAVGLSKKNFKDALGLLYRRRLVEAQDLSVRLVAEEEWSQEGQELVSSMRTSPQAGQAPALDGAAAGGQEEGGGGAGEGDWGNFSPAAGSSVSDSSDSTYSDKEF